jgi:hypothetical protein
VSEVHVVRRQPFDRIDIFAISIRRRGLRMVYESGSSRFVVRLVPRCARHTDHCRPSRSGCSLNAQRKDLGSRIAGKVDRNEETGKEGKKLASSAACIPIRCFAHRGRSWSVLQEQEGNRCVLIRFARRYRHRATGQRCDTVVTVADDAEF